MKQLIRILCVLCLGSFAASYVHAQELSNLSAIESTTPASADSLPAFGTFYSAQNPNQPPFPGNIFGLPAWDLGGGIYLLDDLDVDYTQARSFRNESRMSAMDDLSDDDFTPAFSIPTNGLWLEITNVANRLAYVNLHHATNKVYEVWSKTDLALTNWNIELEVSPTNATAMPFRVPELNRMNLFLWARDWTGITSHGNTAPEWWLWKYFGTVNMSDTNLDNQGDTFRYDYTNGLDPNVITFSLQFTNTDLNSSPANGTVTIQGGAPSYIAVLVNDTNQAAASWQPYSSTNIVFPLNSGNGLYNVQVGLRGLPSDARQSWVSAQLTLDTVAPRFVVTSPTNSTVSVPMIQLQGYASASLSSLTYDVSNAAGIFTNQQGYWQPVFYDTNLLAFTTNSFQCYDVTLTNGLNRITLHATDVAGNSTTTNFSYTLDYSGDTTAPVLSVIWPTNGTSIASSNFTVRAQLDDTTATATATINSNTVVGLIERSGAVWFNNLPLNSGTNTVTITATDAAGNMSTTNLNVVQSAVSLSINPLTSDQLNRTNVTVSGTIGDSSEKIIVNGVSAVVSGNTWTATNVPVSPTGTAGLNVQVNDSSNNLLAAQSMYQPQPAQVVLASYKSQINDTYQTTLFVPPQNRSFYNIGIENIVTYWSYVGGGIENYYDHPYDTEVGPFDIITHFAAGANGFSTPWENVDTQSQFEGDTIFGPGYPEQISESSYNQTQTHVMIQPAGQQSVGQTMLYLVQAQVTNEDTGLRLLASAVRFVNQLAGTTTVDVTDTNGIVWSEALVSAPAGAQNVEVTPTAAGNINFSRMQLAKTKEDWQAAVRQEINQDSGYTAVISEYLASNGFSFQNRKDIKAIYAFYQKVYLEQPTEYYWCGLAKLAGAPVYAGLSDAQQTFPALEGFQQTIIQMNIDILNDLAWQFEAYRKGGLQALEAIYAVKNQDLDISSWREIDQGIQQNNQAMILSGNEALLSREQQQVLPPDYTKLSTFDTALMSIFAQCPVWNSSSVPYPGRDFSTIMGSGHNIADTTDRWNWITTPTYGIWDTWVNLSSDDKSSQVSTLLTTRAVTYSTFPAILFNY